MTISEPKSCLRLRCCPHYGSRVPHTNHQASNWTVGFLHTEFLHRKPEKDGTEPGKNKPTHFRFKTRFHKHEGPLCVWPPVQEAPSACGLWQEEGRGQGQRAEPRAGRGAAGGGFRRRALPCAHTLILNVITHVLGLMSAILFVVLLSLVLYLYLLFSFPAFLWVNRIFFYNSILVQLQHFGEDLCMSRSILRCIICT